MAARPKEIELATQRNYRKFTAQQKLEIVLAGLRGDRTVKEVCREHEIAEPNTASAVSTRIHAWQRLAH